MTARRNYAGIGSRRTPDDTLLLMAQFATHLNIHGWTLRTGGAPGADQAFMRGSDPADTELYLPWAKFEQGSFASPERYKVYSTQPSLAAYHLAEHHHPSWDYLSRGAKALHARNAHQIMGAGLGEPVLMVVCWTPDGSLDGHGKDTGGTGQALRIASGETDAKVFNLAVPEHRVRVERMLGI